MKYTDYENAMKFIPLSPMKFLYLLVIENLCILLYKNILFGNNVSNIVAPVDIL